MAEYKTLVKKIPVSPDKKTKQKDYLKKGRLPIVDQGQSLVGGYTDDADMAVKCELPVIVFGDHTRAVKYITFPFGAGADGIKVLQPKENILPLFLYYATQYIVAKMPNRGYARHYQYVEKEDLPVPPLPEQERIVSRIEELFSQLDAGVETLKKTKAQLAVYRQAVLKEAFEGKYTPDVTMHEIKMGEIADGKDGLRRGPFGSAIKKAFFVESGYKVYEQGNAINNDCKRGHYYISADKYNELSSFQLRPGDFIVSCSGTIGKIAQLPADAELGVINQALMRIRLKPDVIDPYYFMMQFRSEVFQRKIVSRGSGMGNLAGIKEFKLATMFIPENYENQKQIVAEIESRMSVCDSIEQTVDTALQQAEAMRQSILKEAFEGTL